MDMEKENVGGSAGAKAEEKAKERAGETAGETHGWESETDDDLDISTGAFDMEGVVWGAKEAVESIEDSKKDRDE